MAARAQGDEVLRQLRADARVRAVVPSASPSGTRTAESRTTRSPGPGSLPASEPRRRCSGNGRTPGRPWGASALHPGARSRARRGAPPSRRPRPGRRGRGARARRGGPAPSQAARRWPPERQPSTARPGPPRGARPACPQGGRGSPAAGTAGAGGAGSGPAPTGPARYVARPSSRGSRPGRRSAGRRASAGRGVALDPLSSISTSVEPTRLLGPATPSPYSPPPLRSWWTKRTPSPGSANSLRARLSPRPAVVGLLRLRAPGPHRVDDHVGAAAPPGLPAHQPDELGPVRDRTWSRCEHVHEPGRDAEPLGRPGVFEACDECAIAV